MVQVPRKSLTEIPASIKANQTTNERRNEVIEAKVFIKENIYRTRYKQPDLKISFETHYKNKCAYCEQYVERWDIEHYRPVSKYYWLAYSWDNLIFACPTCNQDSKKEQFEIQNATQVIYDSKDLSNIHNLCSKYNQQEKPKLFHPEFDQPEEFLSFDAKGNIYSENIRGKYTIKTCGLNREKLSTRRKELVVDDFIKKLDDIIFITHEDIEKCLIEIDKLINDFAKESKNQKKEFLAFRRYLLKNIFPQIIIQKMNK